MGMQEITNRILSDAANEAQTIIEKAEESAAKRIAEASARADKIKRATESDVQEKRNGILDKKAAAARLDGAKLLLKEKRKVIDTIYDEAHSRLLELSKENTLQLIELLLEQYAEDGDEIFFAQDFAYENEAAAFSVIAAKHLTISSQRAKIDGGMFLKGVRSDKDLSYAALLAADRAENEARLAADIF